MEKLVSSNGLTMSSLEIAELTGKEHFHILRDIDAMLLEIHDPNLDSEEYQVVMAENKMRKEIRLGKDLSICLISGYSVALRLKIIKRWQELEAQNSKPLSQLEMIAQMAMSQHQANIKLLEMESKLITQESKLITQESKIEQIVETQEAQAIDLRNGVPLFYLSKKNAHKLHSHGLSKAIFEAALSYFEVKTQKYIHNEDGYSSMTFGWKEDEIEPAINKLIDDLQQVTQFQCYSTILKKRLAYIK